MKNKLIYQKGFGINSMKILLVHLMSPYLTYLQRIATLQTLTVRDIKKLSRKK